MTQKKRPPGPKKFARIISLGAEKVQRIETMLIRGTPASEIAKIIIYEWDDCKPSEELALHKQLTRYRKEHLDTNIAARVGNATRDVQGRLMMEVKSEQLDVLDDLYHLIQAQKKRINWFLDMETTRKSPLNATRREMGTLLEMYKVYSTLQLETGVLRRAPKAVGHFQLDDSSILEHFTAEVKTTAELRKVTRDVVAILEGEFEVAGKPDSARGTQLSRID